MAILNYTTIIEAEQTIGEIQRLLSRHGVMAMMTEYEGRNVAAVSFKLSVDGRPPMSFKLPCNWRAVATILKNDANARRNIRLKKGDTMDDQAVRVAWRVIKDWVESQLALVEINMVTVPQVFLPYAIMRDGRTLVEHAESDPQFLLGGGREPVSVEEIDRA